MIVEIVVAVVLDIVVIVIVVLILMSYPPDSNLAFQQATMLFRCKQSEAMSSAHRHNVLSAAINLWLHVEWPS